MPRRRFIISAVVTALLGCGSALAQTAGERVFRLAQLALTEASVEVTGNVTLPMLEKLGFVVGRNLVLDARFGPPDRQLDLARELIDAKPDAIIAIGGDALRAASATTGTVPIVMFGPDPVRLGFAHSLGRPGGNVTGIVILATELDGKRLQLLHEAVPAARRVAALHRSESPNREASDADMRAVATATGLDLLSMDAAGPAAYPSAFAAMRATGAQALAITADPGLYQDRAALAALALEARLPTICQWTEMALAGCLLSYGPSQIDLRRRLADYVARIFRGSKPAELPIQQPTTFELIVNLKTAKALGLTIPESFLARADEVIE